MRMVILLFLILTTMMSSVDVQAEPKNAREAIEEYKNIIIATSRKTGTWASVTAAQMILESANPFGKLESEGHNYFGIKWAESFATKYPGAKGVAFNTKEYTGTSNEVTISAKFAYFPTPTDSITEHSIIWWNGCYEPELKILENLNSTMDEFLVEMANGPYCTGSNYLNDLRNIIKENNLTDLDKIAFPEGRKFCGYGDRKVGEYKYPNDGYNDADVKNVGTTTSENEEGISYVIVKEEDLVGMYPKSFFLDKYKDIELPSYDNLSTNEKINIGVIKDNINIQNSWSLWDIIRVFTVFIGLCILVYAVAFIVGFLFDKSNNILELSLISMITLGYLQYSDEKTSIKGYVNKARLFKIEIVLFSVGFFLVGGGLFSFLIDVMWYTGNIFT